jgi:hypothetical protein
VCVCGLLAVGEVGGEEIRGTGVEIEFVSEFLDKDRMGDCIVCF